MVAFEPACQLACDRGQHTHRSNAPCKKHLPDWRSLRGLVVANLIQQGQDGLGFRCHGPTPKRISCEYCYLTTTVLGRNEYRKIALLYTQRFEHSVNRIGVEACLELGE